MPEGSFKLCRYPHLTPIGRKEDEIPKYQELTSSRFILKSAHEANLTNFFYNFGASLNSCLLCQVLNFLELKRKKR
jgi:hypothetical protein